MQDAPDPPRFLCAGYTFSTRKSYPHRAEPDASADIHNSVSSIHTRTSTSTSAIPTPSVLCSWNKG